MSSYTIPHNKLNCDENYREQEFSPAIKKSMAKAMAPKNRATRYED